MRRSLISRVWRLISTPSAFYMMCGLFILESAHSTQRSKVEAPHIAPENLRSATKSFTLGLAVERHTKPLDDFTQSESWHELQKTLDGYSDQITLYRSQGTQRHYIVMALYLLSALTLFRTSSSRSHESKVNSRNKGEQDAPSDGDKHPV
jgi:hypothetical protein